MPRESEIVGITIARPQAATISRRSIIPKVPLFMRSEKNNCDDYDPKVVSLGPYHHGKEELQYVEEIKPIAVEMFMEDSNIKDQDFFLKKILEEIKEIRSCYVDDESTRKYDDLEFAQMMLRDACFILSDIERPRQPSEIRKQLGDAVYLITKRDLYLLENQVPFRVLALLVKLKYGDKYYSQFQEKVTKYCCNMFFNTQVETNVIEQKTPHLFDVFRSVLVTGSEQDSEEPPCCDVESYCSTFHSIICWRPSKKRSQAKATMRLNVFRSVMDLKEKGIRFTPSGIDSLKGVRFTSSYYHAKLKLPSWEVSGYTQVFFKNMIAYELCPYGPYDRAVLSYINFMRSLVITPLDVKELREEKIILNSLGSDEEVAQVYKELKTYGAEDPTFFMKVKREIHEHYTSRTRTWIAELMNQYFKSPWSGIAFVVGIFLTILTFVQAYYGLRGKT